MILFSIVHERVHVVINICKIFIHSARAQRYCSVARASHMRRDGTRSYSKLHFHSDIRISYFISYLVIR